MFVFSSHTCPAHSETSTAALTTPALDRRSLRWFGISACTATPQDPPPSLAQHGSCRRSSTSSSLPFRTHMGAENSVVVVDLPRCGPMLSPRVPNLVPIPGARMERETAGQRPRSNCGHPQATALAVIEQVTPAVSATTPTVLNRVWRRHMHEPCLERRLLVDRVACAGDRASRVLRTHGRG